MTSRPSLDTLRRNLLRYMRLHGASLAERLIVDAPLSEDDKKRARELAAEYGHLWRTEE